MKTYSEKRKIIKLHIRNEHTIKSLAAEKSKFLNYKKFLLLDCVKLQILKK